MTDDRYRLRHEEWHIPPSRYVDIMFLVADFCAEMQEKMNPTTQKPLTARQSYQEYRKLADELKRKYGTEGR